jgi:hypothetical protein
MDDRGVIYVATGAGYVELAVQSAHSLRQTNPDLACDLFTDGSRHPGLEVFDRVHVVPEVHDRAKIDCLPLSRFARTLFLDADTLVLAPLGDLFDIANAWDIAMAHEVRRLMPLVREGLQVQTPYAFPQWNSGVILYRDTGPVRAFLADWARRFRGSGLARDQIVLKDMLWETPLRAYVLPPEFNLRRVTMLDAWEPLDVTPTILHSHRLLQHLRQPGAERVTTLARVRELEREALAEEWRRQGRP